VVDIQGRIQDFKLRGAHLKKVRRAEGGANIFGVFRMKNHDFKPINLIFFQFQGGGGRRVRLPLDPPLISHGRGIYNYLVASSVYHQ
jgi:hypothetical protein